MFSKIKDKGGHLICQHASVSVICLMVTYLLLERGDEEKSYFDIVMCGNCYGVGRNGNCELYI